MLGFEGIVNWYENFSVYKYDKKTYTIRKTNLLRVLCIGVEQAIKV